VVSRKISIRNLPQKAGHILKLSIKANICNCKCEWHMNNAVLSDIQMEFCVCICILRRKTANYNLTTNYLYSTIYTRLHKDLCAVCSPVCVLLIFIISHKNQRQKCKSISIPNDQKLCISKPIWRFADTTIYDLYPNQWKDILTNSNSL